MRPAVAPYPDAAPDRDRWIVHLRPPRRPADPWRPYGYSVELERTAEGTTVPVATVLLTNRECPWRCLMCDLWQHTLRDSVPLGAIPAQIDFALARLPVARHIKLYNSGSFFDPGAVPARDRPAIARRLRGFERVIVESHPALIGPAAAAFRDRLEGQLEVAMGLETAHPEVLARLNKRMTLDQFRRAAEFLGRERIGLRVFVLVKPPFLAEAEALEWARRSVHLAFDCGATVVSLIPTRGGNGALEALAATGQFAPPRLATLEQALDDGVSVQRGRVFADLWNLDRLATCPLCFSQRRARLERTNLTQQPGPPMVCPACTG